MCALPERATLARLTTKRMEAEYSPPWHQLPDTILLSIFSYLQPESLARAGCVCCSWQRVAYDEVLWKLVFRRNVVHQGRLKLPPGKTSWRDECIRLKYHVPRIELETIRQHTDQVLHVSFSYNGDMFATSSKDGFIKVWNVTYPCSLRHSRNMGQFSWKYTQFSQFNESDTLLLVSGVYFGDNSTSGEIAIFSLQDEFDFQCRVLNKPYDIFGAWYNEHYLLSGNLHWVNIFSDLSCSSISLNYAFQATESETKSVVARLLQFKNVNSSTIRTLVIADVAKIKNAASLVINPPDKPNTTANGLTPNFKTGRAAAPANAKHVVEPTAPSSTLHGSPPTLTCDKYLIFTKGSLTYTPHMIGIKRLPKLHWAQPSGIKPPPVHGEPATDQDYSQLPDSEFDQVDHWLDLHGHIIGMCLSPDHRYLYVNVRAWPPNAKITDPHRPPPIAQEIDIHVIDLLTMVKLDQVFRSHRAFTPDDDCFFIFLDVAADYVASGAEDKHAYLWDRHYGLMLAKYPHQDVVNSVAFNPSDPELIVTVSDDNAIKIWVSPNRRRELGIAPSTSVISTLEEGGDVGVDVGVDVGS